jgi:predicted dithiol-disulfide oxidoreductase (DUF899 family)
MAKHKVATRQEWLAARNQLLAKEKELTRRGDQLAAERRNLPLGADREGIPLRHRRGAQDAARAV